MSFNALIVNKDDNGKTHAEVAQITEDQLPAGEVTVAVEYSTVNYKDGISSGRAAVWSGTIRMCRGSILPVP